MRALPPGCVSVSEGVCWFRLSEKVCLPAWIGVCGKPLGRGGSSEWAWRQASLPACLCTQSPNLFCASEKTVSCVQSMHLPWCLCTIFSPVLFLWELVYLGGCLIFRPEFVRTGLAKAERVLCAGALVRRRSCVRSVLLISYGDLHRLFACVLTCCSLGF